MLFWWDKLMLSLFCSSCAVASKIVDPSMLGNRPLLSVPAPWWRALTEGDCPRLCFSFLLGWVSVEDWVGSRLASLFLFELTAKFVLLSTFFSLWTSLSPFSVFYLLEFLGLTSTLSETLGFCYFFILFSSMSPSSTSIALKFLFSFWFFFETYWIWGWSFPSMS